MAVATPPAHAQASMMLSSARGESSHAHEGHGLELLSQLEPSGPGRDADHDHEKAPTTSAPAPGSRSSRDKIRSLDGLRGIACLLVFNYHFLWPWTPIIMLGYGAAPPGSLEPYSGWSQLPIICLLHRGRPMVAIFFAISGYVLCRHILRSIHERRLDAAYRSLASAVFRRVFRLYLPPTISMFIVAMLAQMGAYRSEDAIFKGPDSAYINGTIAKVKLDGRCPNTTVSLTGAQGIADYLLLDDSAFLSNVTGWNRSLCLNATSEGFSPARTYDLAGWAEGQLSKFWNRTKGLDTWAVQAYLDEGQGEHETPYQGPVPIELVGTNVTNASEFMFVQMGGSWEEHPFIHDNMTYALQNFTRAYAEWANPFNFGHYHPRYDPHTFTIPMELRGSMFIYIFLLGTAAIKARWRLGFAGILAAYSLGMARWDMATFLGGATLSELDIRHPPNGQRSPHDQGLLPPATGRPGRQAGFGRQARRETALRRATILLALYLLSYPDAAAEYTPGFKYLSTWVPRYYHPLSGWMFYQSIGSLLLLPCVIRDPYLRGLLEGRVAQYLGKISFSLYLVHGPVLHCLGFWVMPRLFDQFGRTGGFIIGWVFLLSITLYLSGWWYRNIDVWSVKVGRRLESFVVD